MHISQLVNFTSLFPLKSQLKFSTDALFSSHLTSEWPSFVVSTLSTGQLSMTSAPWPLASCTCVAFPSAASTSPPSFWYRAIVSSFGVNWGNLSRNCAGVKYSNLESVSSILNAVNLVYSQKFSTDIDSSASRHFGVGKFLNMTSTINMLHQLCHKLFGLFVKHVITEAGTPCYSIKGYAATLKQRF